LSHPSRLRRRRRHRAPAWRQLPNSRRKGLDSHRDKALRARDRVSEAGGDGDDADDAVGERRQP